MQKWDLNHNLRTVSLYREESISVEKQKSLYGEISNNIDENDAVL